MYPSFIRKSQIPDAGFGLFAARDIKQGELITIYYGYIHSDQKPIHRTQRPYCIGIDYKSKRRTLVGIADVRKLLKKENVGLAQMANDALIPCITGYRNNSYFQQNKDHIELRALHDIPEQTEIFVAYGYEYWRFYIENIYLSTEVRKQLEFIYLVTAALEDKLECFIADVQDFHGTILQVSSADGTLGRFSDSDMWLPLSLDDTIINVTAVACLTEGALYRCPACAAKHRGTRIAITLDLSESMVRLYVKTCKGMWRID